MANNKYYKSIEKKLKQCVRNRLNWIILNKGVCGRSLTASGVLVYE